MIIERIDVAAEATDVAIKIVTSGAGYAYAKVFGGLERHAINAIIPAKADPFMSV